VARGPTAGEARPQRVSAQAFEALPMAGGGDDAGVEIEAALACLAPTERRYLDLVARLATPACARPRPRPDRDQAHENETARPSDPPHKPSSTSIHPTRRRPDCSRR
jgi:hypothetical protein